ncbi:sulfotransferase [Vibrio breoganii]|uniref:sulfotransferase n=1 Tax=Vibrio breoganii TaxID=553239 RepID=UPI000C820AD4|nr:sulfotransferase [Vibrio breoganii]PMO29510.1 hypothetical protein BCT12_06600 [Vibrio breoganii]
MVSDMGSFFGVGLFITFFVVLFSQFRLIKRMRKIGAHAQSVLITIGDISLTDEEKEAEIQSETFNLLRTLFIFLVCCLLAFLLPFLVLFILEITGLVSVSKVTSILVSMPFLVFSTLLGFFVWKLSSLYKVKGNKNVGKGFEVRYSSIEKVLHLLAFATRDIQVLISRIEDKFLLKSAPSKEPPPVFVTALPRAGTTLLMELCFDTGRFATQTYREMPFVLVPLIWRKFSNLFAVKAPEVERAHGDGMLVSLESPEAFEEVLWMTYWEEQYHKQYISTWPPYRKSSFDDFFIRYQRKLVSASSLNGGVGIRYLSKNNLNIARIEFLLEQIPDARFLIPFRKPSQHCQSLLQQHLNFLDIHEQDEFSRIYMAGIGHFDFGQNLKPIDFDQWLSGASSSNAQDLSYWHEYWCACYSHLLKIESDKVCFVDFDKLCEQPEHELSRIADFIGIENKELLLNQMGRLKKRQKTEDSYHNIQPGLVSRVSSVYEALQVRATKGPHFR